MHIPIVDLKAQYLSIKPEIDAAVARSLESGQFVLGDEVKGFEQEFAAYCGVAHAVGVNSGTSALHLALLAAGVGRGDEVVTVPFTFVATVAAIDYAGATPVFVDLDPSSYTMDPSQLERAITRRTKAIVPVHLYGHPADMDPILEIAAGRGITVIEDAAQAHGAEYRGQRAGSWGDIACFSFYPSKNLGAYGDAGAVVTNRADVADRVRMLRNWGQRKKYEHAIKGFNYRMAGVQGAVLRVKLKYLEQWTEARRRHARKYDEALAGAGVTCPAVRSDVRHVYHTYVVRSSNRDALRPRLEEQGIQTAIHYPVPVHLQPAFAELGHSEGAFPVSEQLADQVLSLPMYAELTDDQISRVTAAVRAAMSIAV